MLKSNLLKAGNDKDKMSKLFGIGHSGGSGSSGSSNHGPKYKKIF
jgi:hypothetical protein